MMWKCCLCHCWQYCPFHCCRCFVDSAWSSSKIFRDETKWHSCSAYYSIPMFSYRLWNIANRCPYTVIRATTLIHVVVWLKYVSTLRLLCLYCKMCVTIKWFNWNILCIANHHIRIAAIPRVHTVLYSSLNIIWRWPPGIVWYCKIPRLQFYRAGMICTLWSCYIC